MRPSEAPGRKWSLEDDLQLLEWRARKMTWSQISKKFTGRTALSCRLHYRNYITKIEWDKDKLNGLAQCYEKYAGFVLYADPSTNGPRHKSSMWTKICRELRISSRNVEDRHLRPGNDGMARRGTTRISQHRRIAPKPAPPFLDTAVARPYSSQHSVQVDEQIRLPSVQEMIDGARYQKTWEAPSFKHNYQKP